MLHPETPDRKLSGGWENPHNDEMPPPPEVLGLSDEMSRRFTREDKIMAVDCGRLMDGKVTRLAIGLVAVWMAAAPLTIFPAAAQNRNPIFTADREACYGRVYDRNHLASHPQQKVTSVHILRSLGERPEAESFEPNQREEEIKKFRETGETNVTALVTFRDRKGTFYNSLTCNKDDGRGAHCYIECDGGSFTLKREAAGTVLLENGGFVLIGGCADEVEPDQEVHFSPGKDDKVFRLESKPVAACRAEEQKAKPIRAGKPLRERFGEDETFCFGRDYDTAHLASHPRQEVASIRIGRLDPAKEKADEPDASVWWQRVQLAVTLRLKGGAAPAARYTCSPLETSWECHREVVADRHDSCADRSIHLVRGPDDDILVYNRSAGLPIDNACESVKDANQYAQAMVTRTDDKMFRLSRMPVAACR
jgi:hypothetical protein